MGTPSIRILPPPVVLCLWLDRWLIDRDAVLVCAAWGGNMVIMGGAVNGSQVHGQYHISAS